MASPTDNLLLSVVVPVYNGEKFMPGCMESIQKAVQALSPADRAQVELIVCDNHSTDRTREIAEATEPGCAYRIVQPDSFKENRTENWHAGLSQARGHWMMMLHADDLMAPGGLATLLPVCRRLRNSNMVLISGRHRTFTDVEAPGRLRPIWPLPAVLSGETLRRKVLPFHCPFVPFITMRRAVYEKVHGLDFRYELVQDWDLWIRMLAHGDCYYHPQEVGYWRTHGFSPKYATTFAREHLQLAFRMPELIPGLDAATAEFCLRMHVARAHLLKPDAPAETLLDDVKLAERTARERAHVQGQEAALKKQWDDRVTKDLNRLRVLGLSRALLAR